MSDVIPDSEEVDGRCAQCSEDEIDGGTCKYCGWPEHYRGWTISYDPPPIPIRSFDWRATGPNYDASYEGPEDGWVASGGHVSASTLGALVSEIDNWIEEHEA